MVALAPFLDGANANALHQLSKYDTRIVNADLLHTVAVRAASAARSRQAVAEAAVYMLVAACMQVQTSQWY